MRSHAVASRAARAGAVVFASALALSGCSDRAVDPRARMSLTATLGGADTAGYARALEPRPFEFPADHGPHPDFRTEWWYVTGNAATDQGREVGFQVTVFRSALAPTPPPLESAWATNQAWMAHVAVTDVAGGTFHAFERFARGSLGLAGARAKPFRVWVEGVELATVEVEADDPATDHRAAAIGRDPPTAADGAAPPGASIFPLHLTASGDDVTLDLVLEAGKPPVLQGTDGLSQKGPEPGNASYYYSHTRLPTSGTVRLGVDTLGVHGDAWLDREWSTSSLGAAQVGWDWFALQLDDGRELMAYRLRRADGRADRLSDAVVVQPDGSRLRLAWGADIQVEATGTWDSPVDGARYPSGWRIRVPSLGWELDVEPLLHDQELDLSFRYWEGAVRVQGRGSEGPIQGRGYVELTGYTGGAPGG